MFVIHQVSGASTLEVSHKELPMLVWRKIIIPKVFGKERLNLV